jgi:tight adherence protein B
MDTVSKQVKEPISAELKEICNKVNLGISLDTALEESSKHINSQQYKLFMDSVRIANVTGAKLSDILIKIENSISQKMSIYSTVQALTAQGKMSGLIVSIVPFFIIGFVYFVQPEMMSLLFTTLIGNIILLITVMMILLGSFLMNKIAQVDF